ncbi:MutS protein msh4 [Saitoella coloradoensis]
MPPTTFSQSTDTRGSRPFTGRPATGRPTTGGSRPRTGRPRTGATNVDSQVVAAMCEGRGVAASVGLAFIHLATAECVLSEIVDSQTYVRTMHKLGVFDPVEILIPMTSMTPTKSKLCRIVEENLPGATLVPIARKYFNEPEGQEYVQQYTLAEDLESVKVAVSAKFYALSALAACLKYVELSHHTLYAPHSLRLSYQPSEGSMLIDFSTVRNLELVQNLQNPKSTASLFGVLNNTCTPMGARLLRLNVLQPLTDLDVLEGRLDAVEELVGKEECFFAVRAALKPFQDFDKLLTALVAVTTKSTLKHSENRINDVILLKHGIRCIPPVHEALTGVRANLLVAIRNLCLDDRINHVSEMIDNVINEDAIWQKGALALQHQRCYAVRNGVNGLLDVARQAYKEATSDAIELVAHYSEEHGIPFRVHFEASRGFYIQLTPTDLEACEVPELPLCFINVVKKKKMIQCTTLDLIKKNAKIKDSLTEVLLMSDKTIETLVDEIRSEIGALYKVCEGVAMLDMLASFAYVCTVRDYIRPEFTDTLGIKSGRHPIREAIHGDRYIPNDTYASNTTRFQIITGANMSGKSTYLRQVALLSVIAQIGAFVPAEYASFPITKQLFSRVSMDDSVESNSSTFAIEMRETAFILQSANEDSLIIIDELGRGTSTRDGFAITLAVCEALVDTGAVVLFATHFKELTTALADRTGVVSLHMEVQSEGENMKMLYKVADGGNEEEHYGLKLAQAVALPESVLSKAAEISFALASRTQAQKENSEAAKRAKSRKLLLNLRETLTQAYNGSMEPDVLRRWLVNVQERFVLQMEALSGDHDEDVGEKVREASTLHSGRDVSSHRQDLEAVVEIED